MSKDNAQTIRESIPALDACRRYGVEVNKSGFTNCLWHSEKSPSMKVYDGDRGVHCFGCGMNGSVIDLTMRLFDIDFQSACRKLDADFGLHLYDEPIRPAIRKSRGELLAQARKEYEERKARESAEAHRMALECAHNEAEQEVIKVLRQMHEFDPRRISGAIVDEYADAVRRFPAVLYEAEMAEQDLYELLQIGVRRD